MFAWLLSLLPRNERDVTRIQYDGDDHPRSRSTSSTTSGTSSSGSGSGGPSLEQLRPPYTRRTYEDDDDDDSDFAELVEDGLDGPAETQYQRYKTVRSQAKTLQEDIHSCMARLHEVKVALHTAQLSIEQMLTEMEELLLEALDQDANRYADTIPSRENLEEEAAREASWANALQAVTEILDPLMDRRDAIVAKHYKMNLRLQMLRSQYDLVFTQLQTQRELMELYLEEKEARAAGAEGDGPGAALPAGPAVENYNAALEQAAGGRVGCLREESLDADHLDGKHSVDAVIKTPQPPTEIIFTAEERPMHDIVPVKKEV